MTRIAVVLWMSDAEMAAGQVQRVQADLRAGAYPNCPGCWDIEGRDISLDRYRGSPCRKVTLTLSPRDAIARAKAEQIRRDQLRNANDRSTN